MHCSRPSLTHTQYIIITSQVSLKATLALSVYFGEVNLLKYAIAHEHVSVLPPKVMNFSLQPENYCIDIEKKLTHIVSSRVRLLSHWAIRKQLTLALTNKRRGRHYQSRTWPPVLSHYQMPSVLDKSTKSCATHKNLSVINYHYNKIIKSIA